METTISKVMSCQSDPRCNVQKKLHSLTGFPSEDIELTAAQPTWPNTIPVRTVSDAAFLLQMKLLKYSKFSLTLFAFCEIYMMTNVVFVSKDQTKYNTICLLNLSGASSSRRKPF